MRSLVQATPAYELSVEVSPTPYGHNLRLVSFVPTARQPGDQVKFQALLTTRELVSLRDALNLALQATPAKLTP